MARNRFFSGRDRSMSLQLPISTVKPGQIKSGEANHRSQELWGELIGIDNSTDQERTFTLYRRGGSLLIVSDAGCERVAGPDHGLSKADIFQEVMDQFRVHGVRRKASFCAQPA
jgi:hypothetical protein